MGKNDISIVKNNVKESCTSNQSKDSSYENTIQSQGNLISGNSLFGIKRLIVIKMK